MASGVLPVLIGPATRLANYLPVNRKRYLATVRLGCETDSGDSHYEEKTEDAAFTGLPLDFSLEPILAKFQGQVTQTPSKYSAIKIDGKPAYERARAGEHVEMQSRVVTVYNIQGSLVDSHTIQLDVTCGTGTYIRSIGADVARACGTLGHLIALRRVSSGPFVVPEEQTDEMVASVMTLKEAMDTFCASIEVSGKPEVEKYLLNGNSKHLYTAMQALLPARGEEAQVKFCMTVEGRPRALIQVDYASEKIVSLVQFPLITESSGET